MVRVPDGTLRVLVQGLERIRLDRLEQVEPYLVGRFTPLPDIVGREREVEALARSLESLFARVVAIAPYLPEELQLAVANIDDPSTLSHLIAGALRPSAGRVRLRGHDITALPPHRRAALGVARTFQLVRAFPAMTALDNVVVARVYGHGHARSLPQARRDASELLALFVEEINREGGEAGETRDELGNLREKLVEQRDFRQITNLLSRMDWLSGINNEVPAAMCIETLLEVEVPRRAQYLRTILIEINRIMNHLMFTGSFGLELGASTPVIRGWCCWGTAAIIAQGPPLSSERKTRPDTFTHHGIVWHVEAAGPPDAPGNGLAVRFWPNAAPARPSRYDW